MTGAYSNVEALIDGLNGVYSAIVGGKSLGQDDAEVVANASKFLQDASLGEEGTSNTMPSHRKAMVWHLRHIAKEQGGNDTLEEAARMLIRDSDGSPTGGDACGSVNDSAGPQDITREPVTFVPINPKYSPTRNGRNYLKRTQAGVT